MRRRYLVVDQNVYRLPEIATIIANEPNTRFVIPDIALLEMTKSDEWERTLRQSLVQLAAVPHRTVIAHSVNYALSQELVGLKSFVGLMIYRQAMPHLHEIFEWIRTGKTTDTIHKIRSDIQGHRSDMASQFLNHVENKSSAYELITATKSFLPPDLQKRLRQDQSDLSARIEATYRIATSLLVDILVDRGFSRNRAIMYLRKRPVVYRYLVVRAWYCLRWLSLGGFEALKDYKLTNELLDQQYVVTASLFQGILSKEPALNEAYAVLISILKKEV